MDANVWLQLGKNDRTSGITPELSWQVNMLGSLLGDAIAENAESDTLALVEQLRHLCKDAEKNLDITLLQKVAEILQKLPLDDLDWLLRIYTLFFTLINEAEIQEVIRKNQQREIEASVDSPRRRSIAEAIYELKQQNFSLEEVLSLINELDIVFTLTAHPTEARRQTVLQKQRDIGFALNKLNQPHNLQQQSQLIEQIREYIVLLLYTDNIRSNNLTVADEVRNGLYFLRNTIWQTLPQVYADIKFALKTYYDYEAESLPILIRYHSWIGGDCDGNPFINPDVVEQTIQRHQKAALKTFRQSLWELRTDLSLSDHKIKCVTALQKSLNEDAKLIKLDITKTKHFSHEPYRLKINYMLAKIEAKLNMLQGSASLKQIKIAKSYDEIDFLNDLILIQDSLIKSGLPSLADSSLLQNLILQAKTFGFHMAAVDIRQHSEVHESVIDEILRKKDVTKHYQDLNETEKVHLLHRLLKSNKSISVKNMRLSKTAKECLQLFQIMLKAPINSIGTYIISMTHELSDVLEVLFLGKINKLWSYNDGKVKSNIDVVPLFETVDDLERISQLLSNMYTDSVYKKQLKARNNKQESMLGYSDSNKDGGYWAANYLLYQAQSNIASISREHNIKFRIFHGRGGSAGRGGGRLYQSILAMPKDCQNGTMRVTEQGEVITFHYELEQMAMRHYEQTVYAMLLACAKPCNANKQLCFTANKDQVALLGEIAQYSLTQYRQLINHVDFWSWYIHITPIEFISKLPIASRPVSRKAASEVTFNNLRAIPWNFSWTQTRYNVPGWFGIGYALDEMLNINPSSIEQLRHLYQEWPFFTLLINNTQQELAKTHFLISDFYLAFSAIKTIAPILQKDFELAKKHVLAITQTEKLLDNNKILQKSISLRNPYTDVLNLLQMEAMRRFAKALKAKKSKLHHSILLSINGLSAAMQSTG